MNKIDFKISALDSMKKYPSELFYKGNIELLNCPKISIVGTRKPSQYARNFTHQIASRLTKIGYKIVSGGAMGIDAIAHGGAGESNTILISPTGLNIKYPAVNSKLIDKIDDKGLRISQFEDDFKATSWSFVLRNEIVVALGEVLIVSEADIGSGTMRSVEYALKMGKKIYTLPHRLGESKGTNQLLKQGKATAIYDIDEFITSFDNDLVPTQKDKPKKQDEFLEFCEDNPNTTFDECLNKFGAKVYEYELMGQIEVRDNKVFVV